MKKYEKPLVSVIELQLKENIAAVNTTVYKGAGKAMTSQGVYNMALSQNGTGLNPIDGLVDPS